MPTAEPTELLYLTSPTFVAHWLPNAVEPNRPAGHPERPGRIEAVWTAMNLAGYTQTIVDQPASDAVLGLVHPQAYIEHVAASVGGYADAEETFVGPQSDRAARLGAAAMVRAAEWGLAGRPAFAAMRPPGHHALADRAMGFCLYANLALAARHLQQRRGAGNIAILDFDVHHGNGTQDIFYADPTVLTVSIHQHPKTLWPGSGFEDETGTGDGLGACLNLPLLPGSGDNVMLDAIDRAIDAAEAFGPDVILIAAGFDSHRHDPLGGLDVTTACFGEIGRRLRAAAERLCGGRIASSLEGGYNLDVLGESVRYFCDGLGGK